MRLGLGPAGALGLATDWNQMVTWALSFATCGELAYDATKTNNMNNGQGGVIHTKKKRPKIEYRMIMMIDVSFTVLLPCVSIHSVMPRIMMAH